MSTYVPTPSTVDRQWHVIDAGEQVLGRIATVAATLLQGKHKPQYAPFLDTGDFVIITNAAGVKLSCAVVDSRGDLVALARMDGARFYTTDVARGKAALSAVFGQPSGSLGTFASSPAFQNFNEAAQTPLYPFQGALPITRAGETVGAMGCSGASSQQDEDAVSAALDRF